MKQSEKDEVDALTLKLAPHLNLIDQEFSKIENEHTETTEGIREALEKSHKEICAKWDAQILQLLLQKEKELKVVKAPLENQLHEVEQNKAELLEPLRKAISII